MSTIRVAGPDIGAKLPILSVNDVFPPLILEILKADSTFTAWLHRLRAQSLFLISPKDMAMA